MLRELHTVLLSLGYKVWMEQWGVKGRKWAGTRQQRAAHAGPRCLEFIHDPPKDLHTHYGEKEGLTIQGERWRTERRDSRRKLDVL